MIKNAFVVTAIATVLALAGAPAQAVSNDAAAPSDDCSVANSGNFDNISCGSMIIDNRTVAGTSPTPLPMTCSQNNAFIVQNLTNVPLEVSPPTGAISRVLVTNTIPVNGRDCFLWTDSNSKGSITYTSASGNLSFTVNVPPTQDNCTATGNGASCTPDFIGGDFQLRGQG